MHNARSALKRALLLVRVVLCPRNRTTDGSFRAAPELNVYTISTNYNLQCSLFTTAMSAFPSRSLSSHMRQSSFAVSGAGQSPALVARVNEKRAELENLRELRDLSAAVAAQMESLEQKLAILSDGTEGVSVVLRLLQPELFFSAILTCRLCTSHCHGVEQLA